MAMAMGRLVVGSLVVMMAVLVLMLAHRGGNPRVRSRAAGEHESDHQRERDRDEAERSEACCVVI